MLDYNDITNNLLLSADDKPKSEVKSRVKRRLEYSMNAAEARMEKRGLHALNTTDKINLATLSVQRIQMNVEVCQTKLLSYATQESSLKSQIDSAQKIALIVCPEYDENHFVWKRVMHLMP